MDIRIPEELRTKIPHIGAAEQPDPMVWVKLSAEAFGTTWYVIEAQWLETDTIFYGYVVGWDEELTYFNRSELAFLNAKEAVTIAYDASFTPCRLSEVVAHERGDGPKFPLG